MKQKLLAGTALMFFMAGHAEAQEQPAKPAADTASDQPAKGSAPTPTTDDASTGVRDIIVFGQRRAVGETAQRVPIAITAVDQAELKATNSVSLADIGSLAPGVQTTPVGTFPGFPNFSIRGIGVNSSIRSVDPAINIIQDGMVLVYQAGAVVPTFDLDSVEILRGPQGVLFGRNATGGAIVLRTRAPKDQFQLLADVSYGNFNALDANFSIEGPIAGENVLGKIAVLYRSNTGTIRNTNQGNFVAAPFNPTGAPSAHPTGYVGDIDELVIKPTFLFKFSDAHQLTLFTQYQRYNDDGTVTRNFQPAGLRIPQVTTDYGFTPTCEGYCTNLGDPGYLRLRAGHVIGEFVDEIGPGKLTTTLAYRHVSYDSTSNLAGTPYVGFVFRDNVERNDEYSGETRYNVTLAKGAELTAGLFVLRSDVNVLEKRQTAGAVGAAQPNAFTQGQFAQRTDAFAGYLNLDLSILDNLKLSVGGRYSNEKKSITYAPLTRCTGQGFGTCAQTFLSTSRRWTNFSPRVVLNWTPWERILFYASYTAGFRSGNYNPRTTDLSGVGVGPASPEGVDAYEFGVKSDLFDRHVRANVSIYQNEYSDIQQVLTAPGNGVVQSLLNAASARIRGVDGELTVQPVRALQFNANVGYTDAKFLKFNVPVPGVADPTRLKIAKVPKWTVYLAATYTQPVESLGGEISFRVSYDWRSRFETDLPNTPGLAQPAYGLTNANLGFTKDNWSVSVFGRNLFNVYYTETKAINFAWGDLGGAPRTYGVRFTVKL